MKINSKNRTKFIALSLSLNMLLGATFAKAEDNSKILNNENVSVREEQIQVADRSDIKKLSFEAKGHLYSIAQTPSDPSLIELFESLTEEERMQFQETRKIFLSRVISLLHFSRLGIGFGSATKNSVKQIFSSLFSVREELPPEGELRDIVIRLQAEEREKLRLAELEIQKQFEGKKGSAKLRQMGENFIQSLIQSLDKILFQQAKLVANSNEFGTSISFGLTVAAGVKKKVFGRTLDLVFNLGFDKSSNTLVFEVQRLQETLKEAFTPMAIAGLDMRLGMYFRNNADRATMNGYSFFPPALPTGMSVYKSYFTAGMASGMAFPPIITDLYSFTSDSVRSSLFRITYSPLVKGFFRFELGNMPESLKIVFYKVQDLAQRIKSVKVRLGAGLCKSALI